MKITTTTTNTHNLGLVDLLFFSLTWASFVFSSYLSLSCPPLLIQNNWFAKDAAAAFLQHLIIFRRNTRVFIIGYHIGYFVFFYNIYSLHPSTSHLQHPYHSNCIQFEYDLFYKGPGWLVCLWASFVLHETSTCYAQ